MKSNKVAFFLLAYSFSIVFFALGILGGAIMSVAFLPVVVFFATVTSGPTGHPWLLTAVSTVGLVLGWLVVIVMLQALSLFYAILFALVAVCTYYMLAYVRWWWRRKKCMKAEKTLHEKLGLVLKGDSVVNLMLSLEQWLRCENNDFELTTLMKELVVLLNSRTFDLKQGRRTCALASPQELRPVLTRLVDECASRGVPGTAQYHKKLVRKGYITA